MKIDLPLETWVDVFGFLPRLQLVQLVTSVHKCQKTIGNRQFVSFVQFFLHKCGEITLGQLDISRALVKRDQAFPDVPMPKNIKSFKEITIRRISGHPSTLDFLQKFQQNSLFTNVNLTFVRADADALSGFLANLLPLIDSVHSITFCDFYILRLIQVQHRSLEQVKMMLSSARVLQAWYNFHDDWLCQWLYTPRQDGKPRVLVLQGRQILDRHKFMIRFVERVKKDFMHSTQAFSFFIHIFRPSAEVLSISLDNCRTSEKLEIKRAHGIVTISRYPVIAIVEWIKEMAKYSDRESRFNSFLQQFGIANLSGIPSKETAEKTQMGVKLAPAAEEENNTGDLFGSLMRGKLPQMPDWLKQFGIEQMLGGGQKPAGNGEDASAGNALAQLFGKGTNKGGGGGGGFGLGSVLGSGLDDSPRRRRR